MALNDQELTTAYADLHRTFPEDMHIARPLINMLQDTDRIDEARELALGMARRMLARGRSGSAIGFLEMCRNLDHPDTDEVEALASIARLTTDGPIDLETGTEHTFTLIDQLSDHEAMDFIRQAELVSFPKGADVVSQGEVSRNFYLILEGHMRVHLLANKHRVDLNTLGPGHYFGEFACVYQIPRSASVTATEPSLVLEFSDASITKLMQRSPIAGERLMDTVRSRLIHAMTHSHPAFSGLPEADRRWLAEESTLSEYQDGDKIVIDGNLEDHGCIVVHGAVDAHVPVPDKKKHTLTLKTGDMFGDVNRYILLPKDVKFTAVGHCLICCIPRHVFQSFMNAYGTFEQWVQAHNEAVQTNLQPLLDDWGVDD